MTNCTAFRLFLISFCVALCTAATFAQTIRRVNNNPGVTGPNIYSTIQAAHDASANGDIIYMEASGTSYGPLTCTKRLTIYGRGYFLSANPGVSDSPIEAYMDAVTFATGSNNTMLSGCLVMGQMLFGPSVSGITIERTYIMHGVIFNSTCSGSSSQFATNCTFKQCFIDFDRNSSVRGGIKGTCSTIQYNATQITIQNCIVVNCNCSSWYFPVQLLNNCLISNSNLAGLNNVTNCTVSNTLLQFGQSNTSGSTFTNCISGNNTLPANGGNQNSVNYQNVYVTGTNAPEGPDNLFRLAEFSPARSAGINGTDVGAFGGANPYVLSGIPPIPTITSLVSNPSGNNNAPLNVRISVRSNN